MAFAYHLVFSCYGFWLPNDPRGSWSIYVGSRELFEYGDATKVRTRRSLAHEEHDRNARMTAKEAMQFQPVVLTGIQARAVGRGIAKAAYESDYVVFACCIMPDHVHLVVKIQSRHPKQMIGHFKARATQRLSKENLYPIAEACPESPWSRGGWCVYIDTSEQLSQAIRYVNENPVREKFPRQSWSFVYAKNKDKS